jgi:2-polyprenyl-3-methyl-5-hydroxy-6-metoxy-1,4-benzoquinol methylase
MSEDRLQAQQRVEGPATMPSDESGWWETERSRWIRERVAALTRPGAVVADVGCGRGMMLTGSARDGRVVVNVDSHRWDSWQPHPGVHYVVADADALPFRDAAFDLVGSFDVLEHLTDDHAGLHEQVRVVQPHGRVVTAVPADPRLWSVHDEAVGHQRRYDVQAFHRLATACGLIVSRSTHFFSFLWLPARLTRRRRIRSSEPGTGAGLVARTVRRGVALCCLAERRFLRRWSIPVGTSLWFESAPTPSAERGTGRAPPGPSKRPGGSLPGHA